MDEQDDDPVEDWQPGPQVTSSLFWEWGSARRGSAHAENQTNPVWDWLVRTRVHAYTARSHFGGPSYPTEPGWCCARYGQSRTKLPDGRTLLVAGEHEDHYDPDFYIYNDVIVRNKDGQIEVFGYPADEFPPTDFHSATLVGDQLILIGNLGYPESRAPGQTQVLSLDIHSLRIERLGTTGENPGWIASHSVVLSDGAIRIGGGKICRPEFVENIDDWHLDTSTWVWQRLTNRRWPRWSLRRKDGEWSRLFEARSAEMWHSMTAVLPDDTDDELLKLMAMNKPGPDAPDYRLLHDLYRPAMEHESIPQDSEDFRTYRINVGGVVVRYNEDDMAITLTVEGELPGSTLEGLVADLRGKLTRLEGVEYEAVPIG